MFRASGNRRSCNAGRAIQQGGSTMTTRYDDRSRNESGDCGLSRRDAVKGAGALALATAASTTSSVAGRTARAQVPGTPGQVTTSDGVNLHYLEAGSGKPILMIPGWSQTAEQFKYQLSGLSDRYRVIAIDMRGHGESDKPEFGYKISRLAKDTHDTDPRARPRRGQHPRSFDGIIGDLELLRHVRAGAPVQAAPDRPDADDHQQSRLVGAGTHRIPGRSSIRSRSTRRSTRWPARTGSRPPKASSAAC